MRQIVLVHNQLLQVGIPESPRYHLAYRVFAVQERTWWMTRHGLCRHTGMRRLILLDCFKVFFYVDRCCRDD